MRVVGSDERSDTGLFAPIERPRLVERLAASATYPITLLIAPAGYGKSVVLRQYLRGLSEPCLRFSLRNEHTTLLSFLRGLTESLRESAPHAITALAGAYERTTASPKRAADLARWMHAHLESFAGVISIDDLHLADADVEVASFLSSLIERTKGRIRWILASRSTTTLPLGTWLAYREADLPIAEEELRFTLEEVRSAARCLGIGITDDEVSDLLTLTEGWPAAISFALRTSTRSSELRNVSALTREMIYRFLAEQVYTALDYDERSLLEVAIALPIIDVAVLERAGFDRALPVVERLLDRTAFIYQESPGIYHCHDLFRDFLRHQSALGGKRAQRAIHERAARALESSGDIEHAIGSYVLANLPADVVRLLEHSGFTMLECARGDVVARAIESLDELTRRENATILALQGVLQAIAGKFARAESLLRRSLVRAGNNRDLFAITSLRLAALLGNQGSDVSAVLTPVSDDEGQKVSVRAEALSLTAARMAIAGDVAAATSLLKPIETLLEHVRTEVTRAKVLHYLGIVYRHAGEPNKAFDALIQSSDLACELHLYGVVSRASAVLSNLVLHEKDDVESQLKFADAALAAAMKAGDAFALQTALLQMLSAHMRQGSAEKSIAIEQRLKAVNTEESAVRYITIFNAMRLAWDGKFGEARKLMATRWDDMYFEFDRIVCGAQYAVFCALVSEHQESIRVVRQMSTLASSLKARGVFSMRSIAICRMFCAIAEICNGRLSCAERLLQHFGGDDPVVKTAGKTVRSVLRLLREGGDSESVIRSIEVFSQSGYGDVARLLRAVYPKLKSNHVAKSPQGPLTRAERHILRLLAEGLVPKEIASESSRSIHTVRVHIANAIEKLECHRWSEAVIAARRLGLL